MNVLKLGCIAGRNGLCNEVICSKQEVSGSKSVTVFFGGDVQDYPEVMASHRDHGQHLKWNLLNIVTMLSLKFPSNTICVIKPKRMEFKTFSCYENFVISNKLGAPTYSDMNGALSHLKSLITNTLHKLSSSDPGKTCSKDDKETEMCGGKGTEDLCESINLIGFSKGCVVLNQLITEVHTLKSNSSCQESEELQFWSKVRSIYWLDGGHSGGKNTWITQKSILQMLALFPDLKIHVHVTPYQVKDDTRPWIGKECKCFVDTLRKTEADIHYKLHFEQEIPSIDYHFRVLEEFKEDV